jgi:hypothetical protein
LSPEAPIGVSTLARIALRRIAASRPRSDPAEVMSQLARRLAEAQAAAAGVAPPA